MKTLLKAILNILQFSIFLIALSLINTNAEKTFLIITLFVAFFVEIFRVMANKVIIKNSNEK